MKNNLKHNKLLPLTHKLLKGDPLNEQNNRIFTDSISKIHETKGYFVKKSPLIISKIINYEK